MSYITVLGIDPASTRNLGVAIIGFDSDSKSLDIKSHYTEVFPDFESDGQRLEYTYEIIKKIINKYEPDVMAIELSMGFGKAFVRQNLQESVGVIKLCCSRHDIEVCEIAPTHIKLVIAGSGKAKKNEMKKWIEKITNIEKPKTEHEADAAACAITYLIDQGLMDRIHEPVKKTKKKNKRKK